MKYPLIGYAPDLDSTTPGVIVNCSSFIPSMKGFEGAPSAASLSIDALAAACQGAAAMFRLDDTNRIFAGTGTKLYELNSTSWTDRTRASGGNYGLATDVRWTFSQFGNVSLAAAKSDILQFSSSGAFANIGASIPKASVIVTVGQFVFAFDVNDQGALIDGADSPHRWWCCAKGDYTNWTPSVSLECASGLLTSAPGPIKAGKAFGETIIAYKERSMFQGVYLGAGPIWDFRQLPGAAGALGPYAVADVGTEQSPMHIIMGSDDFYRFEGGQAVRIGSPLRETVYGELNRQYGHLSIADHDLAKARVRFYYCSSGNTTPDKCVVYNYKKDTWGRDDRPVEMALSYVNPGVTYDALGNFYATYNDLPNVSYDSSFWTARTPIPAIFDTTHTLKSLNGPSTSSSFTTGDLGSDEFEAFLERVIPRWLTKPTSANLVNFHRAALGDTPTTDATTAMNSLSRFDVMREAFWHRFRVDITGPAELAMLTAEFEQGGEE